MNEWNLAPIPEFSALFRIFRALFMRNSRYFIIFWEYPWNYDKIPSKFRRKITKFIDQNQNEMKFHFIPAKKFDGFLLEFWGVSGAKAKKSCRTRKMLKNEPTLAIVAVDTEENEPLKIWGVSFHYFNRILSRHNVRRGGDWRWRLQGRKGSQTHFTNRPRYQSRPRGWWVRRPKTRWGNHW